MRAIEEDLLDFPLQDDLPAPAAPKRLQFRPLLLKSFEMFYIPHSAIPLRGPSDLEGRIPQLSARYQTFQKVLRAFLRRPHPGVAGSISLFFEFSFDLIESLHDRTTFIFLPITTIPAIELIGSLLLKNCPAFLVLADSHPNECHNCSSLKDSNSQRCISDRFC